jgi:hypothetical protein
MLQRRSVALLFSEGGDERWYYTLLMSTGLTIGTISALYGFSHHIVMQQQYSFLVAVVNGCKWCLSPFISNRRISNKEY